MVARAYAGGRTNHWGRISSATGPTISNPTRATVSVSTGDQLRGHGAYYDKTEMLVGVFGENSGLENTPDSPAGCLLPPPAMRAGERYAQKHAKKLGIPVMPIHRAVLTTKQDADNLPQKLHPGNPKAQRIIAQSMRDRAACFWATPCGRGCAIRANYQSTTVHLPPAMATGNLDSFPMR